MTYSFSMSGSLATYPATIEQEMALRDAAAKVKEAADLLRAAGLTPSTYGSIPTAAGTSESLTL